jgi:hypothetical protein
MPGKVQARDLLVDPVGAEASDHHRLGDADARQVGQLPVQHGAARELDEALRADRR